VLTSEGVLRNLKMQYQFTNKCEFPENSVGKLILCKEGNEISLYGNLKVLEEMASMPLDESKKRLETLCFGTGDKGEVLINDIAGSHSDIQHRGKVLGGTQALAKEGVLFAMFPSAQYGPIHPEALERCLSGCQIKLEHKYLDIHKKLPSSFEEYIEKEGKD